jgi:hypothetical protein
MHTISIPPHLNVALPSIEAALAILTPGDLETLRDQIEGAMQDAFAAIEEGDTTGPEDVAVPLEVLTSVDWRSLLTPPFNLGLIDNFSPWAADLLAMLDEALPI